MASECNQYHSELAELAATKKEESYATTMSLDQGKSIFCAAEISITLLKRLASLLEGPLRTVKH